MILTAYVKRFFGASAPEKPEEKDLSDCDLTFDEVFHLLSNSRRRLVIQLLDGADYISLGNLSEDIAMEEYDVDEVRPSSDERKRIYVALYQTHLDKLDDAEIIEYNKDRGIIRPGDDYEAALDVLQTIAAAVGGE